MQKSHPVIAREGLPFIFLGLVLAVSATWLLGTGWSLPFWLLAIFILQFFRDPHRHCPDDPGLVIVPADGRVVAVEKTRDTYLDRTAIKVSIFMNVFNVHSNRSPVEGKVIKRWYFSGSFLNASLDKASEQNERNALWIKTPEGKDIICVQIAGLIARRILCYVDVGSVLARAERYGFIRFGSRVDVYLPEESRVDVAIGDHVKGGQDVLARLHD
ncbi:MAG TPA: phosphatidylserine decarboxylase [Burkholderiales bacterium]|nr:phosphatidylserine decarboxylase [Burkholderiales bacterium]